MKKDLTNKVSDRNRILYKRRMKCMVAITIMSFFLSAVTVAISVLMCIYYKNQGSAVVTFQEEGGETAKQQPEESVEALSGSIYTSQEVEALIEATRSSALLQGENDILGIIQSRLEGGDSTLQIYRDLYPDSIVLVDSGKYHFIPFDESLSQSPYDPEKFILDEEGVMHYDDQQMVTYKGVDVSKYQGEIDWKKVKEAGVDYAILRLGIRGYSEGTILEDETFRDNLQGAKEQGLPVGVYFFTQATSDEEAVEEAQFVLDTLEGASLQYPVFLDIEAVSSANCRTKDLTAQERTGYAKTFLRRIEEAGYEAAIYGNTKTFMLMLELAELEEYDKWFASYSMPLYYPYAYQMLQYSEKGRVNGIPEPVDMNICFKEYVGE